VRWHFSACPGRVAPLALGQPVFAAIAVTTHPSTIATLFHIGPKNAKDQLAASSRGDAWNVLRGPCATCTAPGTRCGSPAFGTQTCWIQRAGFLKRYGLSLRHPHMRRCPAVDPDRELSFLEPMPEMLAQFAPGIISNMDEMRCGLISSHEITIAPRGAETVTVNFSDS
jgi:hypothetical protein